MNMLTNLNCDKLYPQKFNLNKTLMLMDLPSHAVETEVLKALSKVLNPGSKGKKIKFHIELSRLDGYLTNEGFGYIQAPNSFIFNKLLDIKSFKVKYCDVSIAFPRPIPEVRKELEEDRKRKTHVSNVSADTSEDDLFKYFSQFGTVEEVNIGRNFRNKKPLGFACIKFSDPLLVQKVIEESPHMIRNNQVSCEPKLLKIELDTVRPVGSDKYSQTVWDKLRNNKFLERKKKPSQPTESNIKKMIDQKLKSIKNQISVGKLTGEKQYQNQNQQKNQHNLSNNFAKQDTPVGNLTSNSDQNQIFLSKKSTPFEMKESLSKMARKSRPKRDPNLRFNVSKIDIENRNTMLLKKFLNN